jgi:FSR family fosmidomycin resistance protein-like MFS transporter
MNTISNTDLKADNPAVAQKIYSVLFSIAFAHLINDLMQSVIPSTYPILKENFSLILPNRVDYFRISTDSFLQPFIGFILIKPKPYSLAIGMVFTISGLALLSVSTHFG